jgi:trehalose 6-phosphate synthase/phosphatase
MVLSKYQSSASVLESAIKVNPRALGEVRLMIVAKEFYFLQTVTQTKDALKYALDTQVEDIKESVYTDLSFVTRHTLPVWAHIMLSDLKGVSSGNTPPRETRYSVGLGSELSTRNFGAGFESFVAAELFKSYRNTHKRLIVFSGDILYKMHEEQEEHETETDRMHKLPIPEALYINENNLVFVVTRRSKEIIDANFNSTFLGLGAEHGFYCRWPADKLTKDNQSKLAVNSKSITEWQYSQKQNLVSNMWKPQIQNLMEMFCKVTQHTYIEAYEHSLRWHYAAADPEFGFQQSRSMEEYIVKQLALEGVDITRGRTEKERFLEVCSRGVSKGAFLENILRTMKSIDMQADFVLVIGSDETDETMFDVANRLTDLPSAPVVYTATVGRYSSNAKMCISSMTEAINLLRGLANSSKKKVTGRTHSYPDLSKISATSSHDQQGGVRQSASVDSVFANKVGKMFIL